MNPERFRRIKDVFLQARQLEPSCRSVELERLCDGDDELRASVERLLDSAHASKGLLETPALGPEFELPPLESLPALAAPDRNGRRLGNYELAEVLGAGGMGVVYRAVQSEPRRDVALKLLRAVDPGPEVMQRFRLEAQLLGRLQHPGIAQIFEAGTARTETGSQPYLAMEYIRGRPLVDFARELDVRERARLLAQVCDAVHHAHERGVIHRDLKPSNILVDEAGRPKVIDFGIADALDGLDDGLTDGDESLPLNRLGTPLYLSPEQLRSPPRTADRRTDVFTLGLVAAELFGAAPPAPVDVARRLTDPVRIDADDDPLNELGAIVRQATQPRPSRRYATAADLGADLERFVDGDAVAAVGDGLLYRLRKRAGARRHALVAVAALVVSLVALVAAAGQWGRARSTEAVAARSERRADRLQEYLITSLASTNPPRFDGQGPATLGPALDALRANAGLAFEDDPETEAALRATLALLFQRRGDHDAATSEARRAATLGAGHPTGLEALLVLANAELERGDLEAAEARLRAIVETPGASDRTRIGSFGLLGELLTNRGRNEEAAEAFGDLARHASLAGDAFSTSSLWGEARATELNPALARRDPADVEATYRRSWEVSRETLGPAHPLTSHAAIALAGFLCRSGRDVAGAIGILEQSWRQLSERLGQHHPEALCTLQSLACARFESGDVENAVGDMERVVEGRRELWGERHPRTLLSRQNLAWLRHEAGDRAPATRAIRAVVEDAREALPPEHVHQVLFRITYGTMLRRQGRLAEAEAVLQEVADLERESGPRGTHSCHLGHGSGGRQQLGLTLVGRGAVLAGERVLAEVHAERSGVLGEDHPCVLSALHNVAAARIRLGTADTIDVTRALLRRSADARGADHAKTLEAQALLADALAARGEWREAASLLREAAERSSAPGAPARSLAPSLFEQLASLLSRNDRDAEAIEACRNGLDLALELFGGSDARYGTLVAEYGYVLVEAGRPFDAENTLRDAIGILTRARGPEDPRVLRAMNNLAMALTLKHELDEAGFLWEETYALRGAVLGPDDPDTLTSGHNLGFHLMNHGDLERAAELLVDVCERAELVLGAKDERRTLFEKHRDLALTWLEGRSDGD